MLVIESWIKYCQLKRLLLLANLEARGKPGAKQGTLEAAKGDCLRREASGLVTRKQVHITPQRTHTHYPYTK